MTAVTEAPATLREILLDSLEDAYWYRRGEVEGCVFCHRNPAGVCGDHQADNDLAWCYEQARKQIERSPDSPEVRAVLADLNGGES